MVYALAFFGGFFVLWVLFLAVMNLAEAKAAGTLKGFALWMGYPVLWIGLVVDLVVQIGPASLLWLELPRELTVSTRIDRLVKSGSGWRRTLALWFRATLLTPFDRSGGHG